MPIEPTGTNFSKTEPHTIFIQEKVIENVVRVAILCRSPWVKPDTTRPLVSRRGRVIVCTVRGVRNI